MSITIEPITPASTQRTDRPNVTRYMADAGLHTDTEAHMKVPHHVDETASGADFAILVGKADQDEHGE